MKKNAFFVYFLLSLFLLVGCSTQLVIDNTTKPSGTNSPKIKDNVTSQGNETKEQFKYSKIDYNNIPDLEKNTQKNLLLNIYLDKAFDFLDDLEKVTIEKTEPILLSVNNNTKGYLILGRVQVNAQSVFSRDVLAIIKEKINPQTNKVSYELIFNQHDNGVNYSFIDINNDGIQEIQVISNGTDSEMGHTQWTTIKLYKYQNGNFSCIFDQILSWVGFQSFDNYTRYSYENSFEFTKNQQDPNLSDIIFNINTEPNPTPNNDCEIVYDTVQDTVTFTFDGEKYVPNKEFYDYNNPTYHDNPNYKQPESTDNVTPQENETEKQTKYSKIDYNNIPDLEENTLKNLLANIFIGDNSSFEDIFALKAKEIKHINLSTNAANVNDGYIIEGSIQSIPRHPYNVIAVIKENKKTQNDKTSYKLVFNYDGLELKYDLVDIDIDGRQEILIFDSDYGACASSEELKLFKYQNNKFSCIFNEGLSSESPAIPTTNQNKFMLYCYKNNYEFVKSKDNPKLFDIIFNIETQPQELVEKWNDDDCDTNHESIKDTVIFTFDGEKYVPNKEFYDYKNPKDIYGNIN